jgi:hypothetical protein
MPCRSWALKMQRSNPTGGRQGWLAFEARSSTATSLKVAGPGKGKTVPLTSDWKKCELPGKRVFIDRNKFAISLAKAGELEI